MKLVERLNSPNNDVESCTMMSKEERLEEHSYEAITGTAEETTRGMRSRSTKKSNSIEPPSVVEDEGKGTK